MYDYIFGLVSSKLFLLPSISSATLPYRPNRMFGSKTTNTLVYESIFDLWLLTGFTTKPLD